MISEFGTPLHEFDTGGYLIETNKKIANYVYEQENKENKKHSLVGKTSFHTDSNLTDLGFDWSEELQQIIIFNSKRYFQAITGKELENYRIDCWAVLLRSGDVSSLHTHPGSEISGAYYVKVPKQLDAENREGQLTLIDPRPAARQSLMFAGKSINVIPEEGKGVIFPSWVEHSVYPHQSDEDRISVSWNIVLL